MNKHVSRWQTFKDFLFFRELPPSKAYQEAVGQIGEPIQQYGHYTFYFLRFLTWLTLILVIGSFIIPAYYVWAIRELWEESETPLVDAMGLGGICMGVLLSCALFMAFIIFILKRERRLMITERGVAHIVKNHVKIFPWEGLEYFFSFRQHEFRPPEYSFILRNPQGITTHIKAILR